VKEAPLRGTCGSTGYKDVTKNVGKR